MRPAAKLRGVFLSTREGEKDMEKIERIERDKGRFHKIVQGKIKQGLRKYMTHGEMIGKKGKDLVSIPMPQIDLPHFRYGRPETEGVGQGGDAIGTPIGVAPGETSSGAGDAPGEHILEVEVSLEELAKIMGEELALPRIEPRGRKNINTTKDKYTGISRAGPEPLRHFKRTYKEGLKRTLAEGTYNPKNPKVIPVREDRRYRSWKETKRPASNAVIIYMMDVSGSMGEAQKEIVRLEAFWIDTWLRFQYDGIASRYIIHDSQAHEVDKEAFYRIRNDGGTKISSAYALLNQMIDKEFSPDDWNIYPFHFSDGDNWGGGDTEICIDLLEKSILPRVNLCCYGQVGGAHGSGDFLLKVKNHFEGNEKMVTSKISSKEQIYDSIKEFLGKGK